MEINYKEKVLNLISTDNNQIISKLIEYEFKIQTFISALSSFKKETLLRPFPHDFLIEDKKDFDRLHKLIELIPNSNKLNSTTDLPDDCWKLIYWILTFNSIELKLLNKEEVKQLFTDLKLNLSNKLLPNYVFKFDSSFAHSNHRARHNLLKDEWGSYSAYHGTPFENLHSIMHNCLVNNLNKRDAFGSGLYLSRNLDVAITFSPFTNVKLNDSIYRLSCVLVCDVVSHPKNEVKVNSSYLLVKDDNLVNIKYLFVYWQKLSNQKSSSLPKFELLLLLLGMACLIYSIYRNNRY